MRPAIFGLEPSVSAWEQRGVRISGALGAAIGVVFALCLVVGAAGAPAAGPSVTVTDLGTLGGSYSKASALNSSGEVVGTSLLAGDFPGRAFVWTQAGGMVNLGSLGGGPNSEAYDVNAGGRVVGYSALTPSGDPLHAFSWTQLSGMVDLGTLAGDSSSAAKAVSETGQVVGASYTTGCSSCPFHGFSWTQAGGMVNLGTLGGNVTDAVAVSDSGQVAGQSYTAGGDLHGFSWTHAGGIIDLGTLGGNYSFVHGLNASGQIVGESYVADGSARAFLWTQAGGMVNLGCLSDTLCQSYALGVNDSGAVVGSSFAQGVNGFEQHAFLWTQAGGMLDLGTLGGDTAGASEVNGTGQVVGYSNTVGDPNYHAFSWTPADGMVDLGALYDIDLALNDDGAVIGTTLTAGGERHATLWQLGPTGPVDADGDGIDDAIDTGTGTFQDAATTAGTIGTIPTGYSVTVTDLPDPDGVHITVTGTGTQKVTITLTNPSSGAPCGTIRLLPGSDAELTCGSITVRVAAGSPPAEIVLSDDTSAFVESGEQATISIASGASFVVTAVSGGDGKVTLTSNGVSTQVGASPTPIKLWDFVGFSQPVDNGGVFNVVKPGSNVPLKWRLLSEAGTPVTTLTSASVAVAQISCQGGAGSDQIEEVAPSSSGLQNLGNGYYQLNWKSDKKWTGCKVMRLSLVGEGPFTHDALFDFK